MWHRQYDLFRSDPAECCVKSWTDTSNLVHRRALWNSVERPSVELRAITLTPLSLDRIYLVSPIRFLVRIQYSCSSIEWIFETHTKSICWLINVNYWGLDPLVVCRNRKPPFGRSVAIFWLPKRAFRICFWWENECRACDYRSPSPQSPLIHLTADFATRR